VILGIPISIGFLVFAKEFILALSGPEFASATLTMQITAPLAIIIGLGHLFGFQLLIPAGLEKKYLIATMAGMLVSVALNLLLISSLKDKGAAIAIMGGEMTVTFISFYWVNKKMDIDIE
jgi:O-antigen/teichoic acid export membrane protein